MALPSLRLLTWNLGRVHFGARVNRWLGLDSRASDRALAHVAGVIARADVDVAAVQELARPEQLARLRDLLGDEWRAAAPDGERCDRLVGLLARRARAPAFEAIALGARAAQAAALDGGWVVASLHLDAFDGAARRAQARLLLDWAAARREPHLVLAGDLNLDLALGRGADDTATYGALATSLADLGAAAGATALFGRRVDYVLGKNVRGRVEVLRGRRVPLGDHDPLRAEISALPG